MDKESVMDWTKVTRHGKSSQAGYDVGNAMLMIYELEEDEVLTAKGNRWKKEARKEISILREDSSR